MPGPRFLHESSTSAARGRAPPSKALKLQIPARRFAQPEEVAGLIGYLASEQAAMVTGENILIDGGYSSI